MKLYHGTSEAAWEAIQDAGAIQPRIVHRASNWDHTIKSRSDAVYLTDTYAPYFAINALNIENAPPGLRCAIIEVETDDIVAGLVPDEDAFEQASRPPGRKVSKLTMLERTKKIRRNLHRYRGTNQWGLSLSYLGTCAHIGPVPMKAIRRVALIDIKQHAAWSMEAMQPIISRVNFALCGRDYRAHLQDAFIIGDVEII